MPAYVYMLRCADGSLYTGWTNDMEKRLKAHQRGQGAKYTRSRGPVELVYSEELTDKSEALKREYVIKQLSHTEKLKLIDNLLKIFAILPKVPCFIYIDRV